MFEQWGIGLRMNGGVVGEDTLVRESIKQVTSELARQKSRDETSVFLERAALQSLKASLLKSSDHWTRTGNDQDDNVLTRAGLRSIMKSAAEDVIDQYLSTLNVDDQENIINADAIKIKPGH